MMRITERIFTGAAAAALAACAGLAALPEVPDEAVAALGSTAGVPQAGGFVFIDGKYVPPPYTVTRRGNGIFINRTQVVQPVPWAAAASADEPKSALDEDGDFEVVKADETVAEKTETVAEKTETAADDKDELLFGDPDDGAGKREVHAIDALFDDTPAPKKAAPAPERKPQQQPVNASMTQQQTDELRTRLDTLRKSYETALGRGDIYFFAEGRSRVNGTYGSAKTLFSVLPAALRSARTPQDLLTRLNQGGVYFLDLRTCADLNKHRMSFTQLEERWKQIEADEAAKRTAPGTRRGR